MLWATTGNPGSQGYLPLGQLYTLGWASLGKWGADKKSCLHGQLPETHVRTPGASAVLGKNGETVSTHRTPNLARRSNAFGVLLLAIYWEI